MTQLVDHLAEMTGYRDRDVLDVTLVGALRDMVRPQCVAIFRVVGEVDQQRWLTRARQRAEDPAPSGDPLWAELESLPLLDDHPLRADCFRQAEMRTCTAEGTLITTCFPLTTDREIVGVLELHTQRVLTLEEQQLVGGILRVYRNFQGLLDYSERDTLTGLLNRKTFDDAFLRSTSALNQRHAEEQEEPASGSERRHRPTSQPWLGVIDIDHFKSVNDTYGHLIGDEVLLLLSRLMRGCFRLHDQLYRFGGEEFVVLLRANSEADAQAAFERLRATVQSYAFPQVGHITISSGFTEVRAGDTPSGAFERADKAVYYAKQNGRNRVVSYQSLVAQGVFEEDRRESDVELF
jgi:diguanylate cyclase (GGDEF)-like protein